jgi:chitinase
MMKGIFLLIQFIILVSFTGRSQGISETNEKKFKIIGYYLLNSLLKDTVQNDSSFAFLDYLTHVNLAFINPDTTGNFRLDLPLDSFVKRAHDKRVKVLPSIAGGGPHTYYAALLRADKRQMLVNNLVAVVDRYDFDGVDVDLEGNDIDSNYEAFVTELSAALKPKGKLLTAAIATAYKDKLSDIALARYDFVNIMSYDRTGPWNPAKPGHHSPYAMAEEDLEYWSKVRMIPKERMVLGLPFYGYGFGTSTAAVASMSFKDIAVAYPESAAGDTLLLPDQRTMYYNGTATIKKKTALATKKASGVMIWQVSGDAPGKYSLLKVVKETILNDQ